MESAQHAAALGEAWRTMRRARTSIVAHVAASTDDIHLEVGDVETLDQIAVRGGLVQMSELAAELQVAPSTTTKAVGRLVDKGLAVRHRDRHDRRVWRVSLTEAGVRAHTIARDRRLAFACRVLARFEPADQEAIGRLMPGLAEALGSELRIPIGRWADTESDTSVARR
ncbi:MAG: MarR family transcriptional regulator [Acidimicrobiia bacterium]|nr:MarR family transcriptional regulator [Acidimicrobiia bacterium]